MEEPKMEAKSKFPRRDCTRNRSREELAGKEYERCENICVAFLFIFKRIAFRKMIEMRVQTISNKVLSLL